MYRWLYIFYLGGIIMATSLSAQKKIASAYIINGLDVPIFTESSDTLPIVYLDIVFQKSGQIANTIDGTAYFVAKVLNEGSAKKPFEAFHKALEKEAINLSVSSGSETIIFSLSALKESFPKGLKLLQELLLVPNLSDQAFSKVSLLINSQISQKVQDFDSVAQDELYRVLFKGTPYENDKIGTKESLEKMSRKHIQAFIDKQLILNHVAVLLGGDFDKKTVESIKQLLSTLPHKSLSDKTLSDKNHKSSPKLPMINPVVKKGSQKVYKDTQQAYIYFGAPYAMRFDDKALYKAKVAFFILGSSGFGSRLMEKIRVKEGLAYSIYAYLISNKTYTLFQGHMQTSLKNEKKAIAIIQKEIKAFVDKGVTKAELESAKQFIVGSEPLRNETINQRLWQQFYEWYKDLGEDSQKRFLANVKALTLEDLNDFIASHQEINQLFFSIVTKK